MVQGGWRHCNTCKKTIGFSTDYYVCNVSTCHRKGTDFVFCTVECWEAHVPLFRHRDAWAEERRSPPPTGASRPASERTAVPDRPALAPAPRDSTPVASRASTPPPRPAQDDLRPLELHDRGAIPEDILVVASKLKAYIRARSGMNTSDGVLPALSRILRDLCDEAIERAHADGRKTVMDRDLP